MRTVKKRTGETVHFSSKKIFNAIKGAAGETGEMTDNDISQATLKTEVLLANENTVSVEEIQDTVEEVLMDMSFKKTAKAYILYRQKHKEQREASMKLMEQYNGLLFADSKDSDLKRDNANINTDAPMGIMLKLGTEGAKTYADHFVHAEEFAKADKENYIHIHDKDFSLITLNCCQIDLGKLLKGGFCTGHGFLREPNSIRSAGQLACIAIQSNQNDQFGGQSINALDFCLAPYVKKSFKKAFYENVKKLMSMFVDGEALEAIKKIDFDADYSRSNTNKNAELLEEWAKQYVKDITNLPSSFKLVINSAWDNAVEDVEEETKQAMEALIHNFNSLHSRAGRMAA